MPKLVSVVSAPTVTWLRGGAEMPDISMLLDVISGSLAVAVLVG
jgi:hypothetical protein